MKSSIFAAATAAALAMASPLDMEKRKYETSWVVVEYTVTVTGTETPTSTAKPTIPFGGGQKQRPQDTIAAQAAPTSTPDTVIVTVTASDENPVPTTEAETKTQAAETYPVTSTAEAPAETADSTVEDPSSDYADVAVARHNIHRSNHSAPSVTWSDKLAGYAANTGATCVFKHDMDQGDKGYGQNLAMWAGSSGAFELGTTGAAKMAISDYWYNGEYAKYLPEFYDEDSPDMSDFEGWGHFSEMLWKGVEEIGCVSQFCAKGTMFQDMDAWYTVCNYSPQGNVGGGYKTNVLKPLGKSIVTA